MTVSERSPEAQIVIEGLSISSSRENVLKSLGHCGVSQAELSEIHAVDEPIREQDPDYFPLNEPRLDDLRFFVHTLVEKALFEPKAVADFIHKPFDDNDHVFGEDWPGQTPMDILKVDPLALRAYGFHKALEAGTAE